MNMREKKFFSVVMAADESFLKNHESGKKISKLEKPHTFYKI
jgi:hypothetical protein